MNFIIFDSPNKDFIILDLSNHLNSPFSSGVIESLLILANPPFLTTIRLSNLDVSYTFVLSVVDLREIEFLFCLEITSPMISVRYCSCPTMSIDNSFLS